MIIISCSCHDKLHNDEIIENRLSQLHKCFQIELRGLVEVMWKVVVEI